jgi:hypothetical protein
MVKVVISVGPVFNCDSISIVEVIRRMAFTLLDTDKVVLTAHALDADGNPTAATLSFSTSDESVVALVDNLDGTAVAVSGADGSATVTATATDADGAQVSNTLDIDVVAPEVPPAATASVTIDVGTPEPK